VTGVAINSSGEGFGLFVQEPQGGQYSGVWVYTDTGAEAYSLGDIVHLTGVLVEFDNAGGWADSVTEINVGDPPGTGTVTFASVGSPLAPTVIPTSTLANPALAEPWEGVLVRFQNPTVTVADLGFGEWEVDGTARIDDVMTTFGSVQFGDTFTSITGALNYTFDQYKLEPRNAADFVGHTASPLPADSIGFGELVITEFMSNPGPGCADVDDEYFEVLYTGSVAADLQGLVVHYGNNDAVITAATPITPGQRILFTAESPSPCYGHTGVEFSTALAQSAGLFSLENASGNIDVIDVTAIGITEGVAAQLSTSAPQSAAGNDSAGNWCVATTPIGISGDLGTPGAPNDC